MSLQLKKLGAHIKKFGWKQPKVVKLEGALHGMKFNQKEIEHVKHSIIRLDE